MKYVEKLVILDYFTNVIYVYNTTNESLQIQN